MTMSQCLKRVVWLLAKHAQQPHAIKSSFVSTQAATFAPHSIERMLHVAAFAVSGYSGTNNRTLKPFNPLLGETFEFQYPEQGWRGIAEKVCMASHHIENKNAQLLTCLARHCCCFVIACCNYIGSS